MEVVRLYIVTLELYESGSKCEVGEELQSIARVKAKASEGCGEG